MEEDQTVQDGTEVMNPKLMLQLGVSLAELTLPEP